MTRRTPPVDPMISKEAKFCMMWPNMGRENRSQQGDITDWAGEQSRDPQGADHHPPHYTRS